MFSQVLSSEWGVGEGEDVALTFCVLLVATVGASPAILLQTVILDHSSFLLYHFMAPSTFNAEDLRDDI